MLLWLGSCVVRSMQRTQSAGPSNASARTRLWRYAWRAGALLYALQLGYLLVANLLLTTSMLRSAVSSSDDVKVEYGSAYSLWPGRVYFSDLALRIEDHNVQVAIDVERGHADIDLLPLMRRKFHARRVEVEGVSYRMRHKLSRVGEQEPRLAAYPKIAGFADPPLFDGPSPPPIPDSEYRLWEIRLSNVEAALKQVWVLEYRFNGEGMARGGFLLRPARYCELDASTLQLDGELHVGETAVAKRLHLEMNAQIFGFDVQTIQGFEPLRYIDAGVEAQLEDMDLSFVNVYSFAQTAKISGAGTLRVVEVRLERGVIKKGSHLTFETSDIAFSLGRVRLQSRAPAALHADGRAADTLSAALTATEFELQAGEGFTSPKLSDIDLNADFGSNLIQTSGVRSARLKPVHVSVPELGWLKGAFGLDVIDALKGSATAAVEAELQPKASGEAADQVAGSIVAQLKAVDVRSLDLGLRGQLHVESRVLARRAPALITLEGWDMRLSSAQIAVMDRWSEPINAAVTSRELQVRPGNVLRAKGSVQAHANRVTALLPLLGSSDFVRSIPALILGQNPIDAATTFQIEGDKVQVELVRASSGQASATGHMSRAPKDLKGALLIETPYANLGFKLRNDDVETKLFASRKWLTQGTDAASAAK